MNICYCSLFQIYVYFILVSHSPMCVHVLISIYFFGGVNDDDLWSCCSCTGNITERLYSKKKKKIQKSRIVTESIHCKITYSASFKLHYDKNKEFFFFFLSSYPLLVTNTGDSVFFFFLILSIIHDISLVRPAIFRFIYS